MQKYSWSDKVTSGLSGIPIKRNPEFLLDYNYLWSMINIFFIYLSYRARLTYFARNMVHDDWLLFLILDFPNLKCRISTLRLYLLENSETYDWRPIYLIDSKKYNPYHSRRDCVKCHYYWILVYLFQLFLLQCNQMYKQYSDPNKYHCLELIFCLAWLF